MSLPATIRLSRPDDMDGWRQAARTCLRACIAPENIIWLDKTGTADLFAGESVGVPDAAEFLIAPINNRPSVRIPRAFIELAECVVCHTDPDRFALLYRVLWRLTRGEPALLGNRADLDIQRLHILAKRISRERHKMHAFVRFKKTPGAEPEHFGAWFEPEHHTLRLSCGFFVRRFSNMHWSIVTPAESAHWDGTTLVFGPGGHRGNRAGDEAMETLWRTYFANIFNPARLKIDAMRSEMPVKYWKNLPEAPLIADLVHRAGSRTDEMIAREHSAPPKFAERAVAARVTDSYASIDTDGATCRAFDNIDALHQHTRHCERCVHACRATQTVNGEGTTGASLMLVGEQAGDLEDLQGRPFVGPAGRLLRELLSDIGVDPADLYLTNAVRHFRFEPRGKHRLHQTPSMENIDNCRQWLFEEIRLVKPSVIVALGAIAGRALLGRTVSPQSERGKTFRFGHDVRLRLSIHPAAVLRASSSSSTRDLREALRADLRWAAAASCAGSE